jgi:hypothetical protein
MTFPFNQMYQAIFLINGQEYTTKINRDSDEQATKEFMRLWGLRRPAYGHCCGWLMKDWKNCLKHVDAISGT